MLSSPAARLDGVFKEFAGRAILQDATYDFEPQRVHVLSGPSGSGKSTLLNLLTGYVPCDQGRVEVPSRIGYLFQESLLFTNLTVEQNLQIRLAANPVRPRGRRLNSAVRAVLERVGAEGLVHTMVAHLSGGERQRVELGGLLLLEPELVLLDEPTSSLDPKARDEVVALICSTFSFATTLIVSHDPTLPGLIPDCVRLRLDNGKIVDG